MELTILQLTAEFEKMPHRSFADLQMALYEMRGGRYPFGYTSASVFHLSMITAAVKFWHDVRKEADREIYKDLTKTQ